MRDDKSHFPRPTGEGLRERGLSAHDEILKLVQDDRVLSKAHSKELNVLTSYRLNDFKKKAGATHVDMSANIRFNNSRHHRHCCGDDNSDID